MEKHAKEAGSVPIENDCSEPFKNLTIILNSDKDKDNRRLLMLLDGKIWAHTDCDVKFEYSGVDRDITNLYVNDLKFEI